MKMIKAVLTLFTLIATLFVPCTFACEMFLFSNPAIPPDDTPPVSMHVLRHRPADLTLAPTEILEMDQLCLNLFPDVQLTARFDEPSTPGNDAHIRQGSIQGIEGGELILAVSPNRIAITVNLSDIIYKVRYTEDRCYIIREIIPDTVTDESPGNQIRAAAGQLTPLAKETQVMELVNQERTENGLPPLSWDNLLFEAAREHSEDMAQQDYFSHDSLDGRKFSDRIKAKGYEYNSAAENIAAGYDTPQKVMTEWMASDGHRNNILRDSVCEIGVGYAYDDRSRYGHYWTQDFGRRIGVNACPQATSPDPTPPENVGDDSGSSGSGGSGCFVETIRP